MNSSRVPREISCVLHAWTEIQLRNVPWLVWLAGIAVFVPTAIGIVNAAQAVVVSACTHYKIDLLYSMIRCDVECLVLLRNFHRLNRFSRRDVKHVQEDRLRLAVVVDPLDDLMNAAITCNTRVKSILEFHCYNEKP